MSRLEKYVAFGSLIVGGIIGASLVIASDIRKINEETKQGIKQLW